VVLVSLGVILIVAAVVIGGKMFSPEPEPKELAAGALQKLNAAQSFRFSLVQHELVGAQEKLMADISGERSGMDISLKGKLAGNDVEMMCFGEDFLNRDMVNQKWVQYPGVANTIIQQLFPVEFNPSTLIELDETCEIVPSEDEVVNGKKCKVYHFTPRITQESLNQEWTNFAAILYVDKSSRDVVSIILTADHKKIERKVRLNIAYNSIGSQISIPRP
jgi:hypothetical protein